MQKFSGVLALLFLGASVALAIRPADLEPSKDCELWVGTASGNDPTVEVQLSLCPESNNEVKGVLQWSSERSGWSRRAVKGAYQDKAKTAITLHDESFLEKKPNPGWRFCLVDEYSLSRSKDKLSGTYYSKDCDDTATLSLTRKP